jgi:hypothetical protein
VTKIDEMKLILRMFEVIRSLDLPCHSPPINMNNSTATIVAPSNHQTMSPYQSLAVISSKLPSIVANLLYCLANPAVAPAAHDPAKLTAISNKEPQHLDPLFLETLKSSLVSDEFISYCASYTSQPNSAIIIQLIANYFQHYLKPFQFSQLHRFLSAQCRLQIYKQLNFSPQNHQVSLFSNQNSARISLLRTIMHAKAQESGISTERMIIYVPAIPFVEEYIEITAFELQLSMENFKFIPILPCNKSENSENEQNTDYINALLLHKYDLGALEAQIQLDSAENRAATAIVVINNAQFAENSIFYTENCSELNAIVQKYNLAVYIEGNDADYSAFAAENSPNYRGITLNLKQFCPNLLLNSPIYLNLYKVSVSSANLPLFSADLPDFALFLHFFLQIFTSSGPIFPFSSVLHARNLYKEVFYEFLTRKQGLSCLQLTVPCKFPSNSLFLHAFCSSFYWQFTISEELSQFNVSNNQINHYLALKLGRKLQLTTKNNIIPAVFHGLQGFLADFTPQTTEQQQVQAEISSYSAVLSAIHAELGCFGLILAARKEFQSLLDRETELLYISPANLAANSVNFSFGCFQFRPIQLGKGFSNEINELLCLKLQQNINFRANSPLFSNNSHNSVFDLTKNSENNTVICINLGILLCSSVVTVEKALETIKITAQQLDFNEKIIKSLEKTIKQGIKEAEKKISTLQSNNYAANNVLRMLPIVGNLYNYWLPVENNPQNSNYLLGQSFDMRNRELSSITYTYNNNEGNRELSGQSTPNIANLTPKNANSGLSDAEISEKMQKISVNIYYSDFSTDLLREDGNLMRNLLLQLHDGFECLAFFPVENPETLELPGDQQFTSAEIFIFYESSFLHSKTSVISGENSAEESAELSRGPILAWCEQGQRYLSADQTICLEDIRVISLGYDRPWNCPGNFAGKLDPARSISLVTQQVSLHLQAKSVQQRNQFFLAIYNYLASKVKINLIHSRIAADNCGAQSNNANNSKDNAGKNNQKQLQTVPIPTNTSKTSPGNVSTNNSAAVAANNNGNVASQSNNRSPGGLISTSPSPSSENNVIAARALLERGQPFVVYVLDKNNIDITTRHEVILWYRPANSGDNNPLNAKGNLAWCKRGEAVLDYSPNRSLPLSKTVQISMGKQTKAFKNKQAAPAEPGNCFSIIVEKIILNLEAASNPARTTWLAAFHAVMTAQGKQRIFDQEETNNSNNKNINTVTATTSSQNISNHNSPTGN